MNLLSIFLCWLSVFAQLPYDTAKVTTANEISLTASAYRGIEDRDTIYYVSGDPNILTAYTKDGTVKWRLDVSKIVAGKVPGTSGIRYVSLKVNKLDVIYAKHSFVEVNAATGEGRYLGSD